MIFSVVLCYLYTDQQRTAEPQNQELIDFYQTFHEQSSSAGNKRSLEYPYKYYNTRVMSLDQYSLYKGGTVGDQEGVPTSYPQS